MRSLAEVVRGQLSGGLFVGYLYPGVGMRQGQRQLK
jgi:hypothetical protein